LRRVREFQVREHAGEQESKRAEAAAFGGMRAARWNIKYSM